MKHRNVEKLLQLRLDTKTLRALDVFKVYPAKCDADVLDHGDDFIGIPGEDFDVYRVDIGKPLEEHAFALHHRFGGQGPKIAQAQDRRAIGDHRHQIALGGIVVGKVGIAGDRLNGSGYAGGIGERQIPLCRHRLGRRHRDLSRGRIPVEGQRLVVSEGGSVGFAHGPAPP